MKKFVVNKELFTYDICKKVFYTLKPNDIVVGFRLDDFYVYYKFNNSIIILTIDEHMLLDEYDELKTRNNVVGDKHFNNKI